MKASHSKTLALCSATAILFGMLPAAPAVSAETAAISVADAVASGQGVEISADQISTANLKETKYNNPISSDFFCADPTAVEYDGRLYLYGTNDHQQFELAGGDRDNTYEKIKSMLVFSTEDMVNWIYHGEINIGDVAPWITNSWAPSIVSRKETDGLTHFYMYFSNNGLGVGVITSTDPVTGWTDPLGHALISTSTPGLTNCPNPFDPGAVIDDNGVGWLSFGAGTASGGSTFMPGSARIVRLGSDMISFDSDFAVIPAAYNFEASELNYINGTYVYTYCSDWSDHSEQWPYDCPVPGGCGMVYMTTKTPLDSNSWEMQGECFINPGAAGFDYSNNHTHMHKFKGKWYIFYHTLALYRSMGISGSFRSMAVDEITVDEQNVKITTPAVISNAKGSWYSVRSAVFTQGDEEPSEIEKTQTDIDTISYQITVTSVTADTTVTMYPATNTGTDCPGSVKVTGTGKYTITCEIGGAKGFMNMGYFRASDDTAITFMLDSITVNGKYSVDIGAELTNTREWADGLRNIWNGYSDGDKVYTDEYAEFRYIEADSAIELFAAQSVNPVSGNAPLIEDPMVFLASVKGSGRIEVRLDSPTGAILTSIDFDSPNRYQTVYQISVAEIGGKHDLYFVFSDANITMQSWCFTREDGTDTVRGDVNNDGKCNTADAVMLQKWLLSCGSLPNWKAGDMDGNRKINASDLTLLKQTLLY